MNRSIRILISFIAWLIPVSGIYFSTQIIYPNHIAIGITLVIISTLILAPFSGILLDALTNDRVIYLNVDKPWMTHLEDK
jgi:hypothetical protein